MSTPMKALVVLNAATLVAVVLLAAFVVANVNGANDRLASIAAALPESGLASSAEVQAAADASEKIAQAVADLSVQVAALSADMAQLQTEVAAVGGAVASPAPGASLDPDSALGKVAGTLGSLQETVLKVQQDLETVRGFVQSICTFLGRC
jgi:hypothetical protein